QPVDDLVLIHIDRWHVDAVEGGADAHSGGVLGLVGDFGRVQQRLSGDTAAVQARPADLVFLDQHHSHAKFGRPQRAGIPAAHAAPPFPPSSMTGSSPPVWVSVTTYSSSPLTWCALSAGFAWSVRSVRSVRSSPTRAARPPRRARSGPGYGPRRRFRP